MTTQILEIDSLRKTYGKGNNQTKALNGITFQVMAGEFLGIMGSSEGADPPAGYYPGGRAYGRPGFRQCKVADGKAVRTEPGTQYHHPHGHP